MSRGERGDKMRARFFATTSSTIVLAFAGALVTATLATAAAPIPNFNVTAMPGNEAEDAIAVNPANASNVVAMSTLPDVVAGLAVGVSFNSGHTWARRGLGQFGAFSTPERVPTSNGRGDYGDTAVGPNGQVMVTYQDKTGGQVGSNIYTAVDPDGLGSAGFNDPRFLAHTYVGGFDYIPAQPDRSVDAEANLAWDRAGGAHTGRAYVIWTQETPNESDNMDIMFQCSDN